MARADHCVRGSSLVVIVIALAAHVSAQAAPTRVDGIAQQTWTGRVCRPDGAPAAGAVVVTSAGGRAVAAADGSFTLALQLPRAAESVAVSATLAEDRRALAGYAQLVPAAAGTSAALGTIVLAELERVPPDWRATFGGKPGLSANDSEKALAVFDDGNGPALYVGGNFGNAGGVPTGGIARWDGERWTALADVLGDVNALATFDDGGGTALYAGGGFTSTLGGVSVNRIARWDGASWSALGSGLSGAAFALAVHDDGNGSALYVGGTFLTAGGTMVNHVAKWDGAGWSALGSGVGNNVYALTSFDDGSGAALFAAGDFTTAGGAPASRVARWDGASWAPLGAGIGGGTVTALAGFDGVVYAGGIFNDVGGSGAAGIARWNGSSWSPLGSGLTPGTSGTLVRTLIVFDDGEGTALLVGGAFAQAGGVFRPNLARWDGSSWSGVGGGIPSGSVAALGVHDDGAGPALYAAGAFTSVGGTPVLDVARFDGTSWSSLGKGLNGAVHALIEGDVGDGRAVYAGGAFTAAGGGTANRIARWTGAGWSPLGSGTGSLVTALTIHDDGSGRAVFAGGLFQDAGGTPAQRIAKWDGTSWSALGAGITGGGANRRVTALASFDDGTGPALYAGGNFTRAADVTATLRIARWDGASWSSVGGGMDSDVNALAVFDDGTGPALYAGGAFTSAGGTPASAIAKWDGASWSGLGSGLGQSFTDPIVFALAVFDAGSGPELWVGGLFSTAGGASRPGIARWNGTTWAGGTGGGVNDSVFALAVHDDGAGPALFAGGRFSGAGGLAAQHVARFDGTSWAPLGEGTVAFVRALVGTPRGLPVGGDSIVSTTGDSYLASWATRNKALR